MAKPKFGPCPVDGEICTIGACKHSGCQKIPPPDDSYSRLENGVLDKAKEIVTGRDKQDNYGPPDEFVSRLAKVWSGYLGVELKPTDAAMMMALLKACRLRTNPNHEDSLVDFAGWTMIFERVK